MDIFRGHHKFGLYLGAISMHFRVFSQGQGKDRGTFDVLGLLKFQIFLGCLKFLIFFGVNSRCTYVEINESNPPPHWEL